MKRMFAGILALLLLTGCTLPEGRPDPLQPLDPPSDTAEIHIPDDPAEPEPIPEPPSEEPVGQPDPWPPETEPEPVPEPTHTELYLPDVPVEDVVMYFNEVCLDAEIVNSGDPSRLQKWTEPIFCQVLGMPTDEDLAVVEGFAAWLNTIEGFPGITWTEDAAEADLRIHFCTADELLTIMGEDFTHMDGAVTFWYENDAIYDAVICVRTDLSQELRNSVILEEIYNGLGPVQDTQLRPDSIIYAGFSQPQSLTPMDELLLKLLYHPQMTCGMDAAACESVIRSLYY